MGGITAFLKDFDMAAMLPDISSFVGTMKLLMQLFMLLGPVLVLVLGANYYFKPPKEANYSWGFRTYFGMGSVEVWQFTQKLAGRCWMILGGIMTLICLVLVLLSGALDAFGVATMAIWCVVIQLIVIVASWAGINIVVLKYYDKDGNRRSKKK